MAGAARVPGAVAATAALAAAAASGCAGETTPPDAARHEYAVEAFRPVSLIRTLPARDDDELIAEGLALEVRDGRAFVLDAIGGRVHVFGTDGSRGVSIGREGRGPGELSGPVTLRIGPAGDVWVSQADPPRISRFRAGGEPAGQFRPPYPAVNFAVGDGGRPLIPTVDAGSLLAELEGDGDTLVWKPAVRIPSRLGRNPFERILFFALPMARRGRGEVILLQNKHADDFSLWSVRLEEAARGLTAIDPIPLPEWLHALMRREAERTRREAPAEFARGDFMIPFKGLHVGAGGRIQLVPSPSHRVLLLDVPAGPDEALRVVVPSEGEEHRDMMDAVMAEGRLVALYSTEARVYALAPAPSDALAELGVPRSSRRR